MLRSLRGVVQPPPRYRILRQSSVLTRRKASSRLGPYRDQEPCNAALSIPRGATYFSTAALHYDDDEYYGFDSIKNLTDGPSMELGLGKIANQTYASVVGTSGSTVLLSTVARQQNPDGGSFLTVDYRQRTHGVGQIPGARNRRDNTMPTPTEVLAARAIDRALRPLLSDDAGDAFHFHVQCSVQAYQLWPVSDDGSDPLYSASESGHPVALALNSAAAALSEQLTEPVAATVLALMPNGTLVQDPTVQQIQHSHGELLYAGTRDKTVMMEWSSHGLATGLPEEAWDSLLKIAHATIQPLLDTHDELRQIKAATSTGRPAPTTEEQDTELRASLGLPSPPPTDTHVATVAPSKASVDAKERQRRLYQVVHFCEDRLGDTMKRVFGRTNEDQIDIKDRSMNAAFIHKGESLLPKTIRGRREQLVLQEISRQVDEFLGQPELKGDDWLEADAAFDEWIHHKVANLLFRRGLMNATTQYGTRADSRGPSSQGWKTVRPVRVQVPALPLAVHGSCTFARGDTQVLCTTTLGPPRDGVPVSDPYQSLSNPRAVGTSGAVGSAGTELPVGSLRFLRNQEALVSDLNSKRVMADKERTGASGNLADIKRAFLQYDFPSYSTGEVPAGSPAHNRRAIGHGALAERAVLPVLPAVEDFPYAIRITSEVTDSNGSSSMASVCGATLALLDAGVPIIEPVAGVSVGAAVVASDEDKYGLLLDITGTEDHYGDMDFKIAGTGNGVTALQLDVKRPLRHELLIDALELARAGRRAILAEMGAQAKELGGLVPRPEPKESAPRVEVVRFDPRRKRDLVGPGGAVLRQLEERYGVSIDLTQEGQCLLFGADREMVSLAKSTIMDCVADVVEGDIYEGTVVEIKDFGAVVELLRNKEGLLHMSELSDDQVTDGHHDGNLGTVNQHLRLGQKIRVRCTGVDVVQGTIKLSRKGLA